MGPIWGLGWGAYIRIEPPPHISFGFISNTPTDTPYKKPQFLQFLFWLKPWYKVLQRGEVDFPALKISWGPPTANLWPDWSPQKRVNHDKLDQRQKMRKSRFNHQFCTKTCFNHQYCAKINYFFTIQCFILCFVANTYTKGQLASLFSEYDW